MGTMNKTTRIILISVGSVLVLFVIISGIMVGPLSHTLPPAVRDWLGINTTEQNNEEIYIQLVVDSKDSCFNESIRFQKQEKATAYTILLQANLTVKINTNYQYGIFIEAINGIEQNATHSWLYYIDGEEGTIAADKCDLRSNGASQVFWGFQKIN
jgi:hypothetical protein